MFFERRLRICTTGIVNPLSEEGVHYTPLPYVLIFRMLGFLAMGSKDIFVDIGCGKGRVLCCASRLALREVIGIELDPSLVQIAQRNVQRLRGKRSPVVVFEGSAEHFTYDKATVVYLYNPFNRRLTERVLDLIHESVCRSPRQIRIVYANPRYSDFLDRQGWLRKYAEWPAQDFPGFGYPVSFWETSRGACAKPSQV